MQNEIPRSRMNKLLIKSLNHHPSQKITIPQGHFLFSQYQLQHLTQILLLIGHLWKLTIIFIMIIYTLKILCVQGAEGTERISLE